ncbi:hypothetical protein EZV62_025661 [Acer yangbiense]|uniref:Auxin-responsive protein n=1 Tax=Acer yangbiense TaxID=1000413 RepID=A0A5C7H0I1_9ROSI|nr:hypothetical protein EZV62_025661 [Acer yangbiense]
MKYFERILFQFFFFFLLGEPELEAKRISLPRTTGVVDAESCNTSSMAEKGHFYCEYAVSLIERGAAKDVEKASLTSPATSRFLNKGHFVVHTVDKTRYFTVPLEYLIKNVFRELLRMSEEEFGISTNGPITLPSNRTFMEYILPRFLLSPIEWLK